MKVRNLGTNRNRPAARKFVERLESRVLLSTYYLQDWDTTLQNFVAHGTNLHQIKSDFSADVTGQIQGAISDVPNGNTLAFPALQYAAGVTGYRVNGTLNVHGRANLTFLGNGAIIQAN